MAEFSAPAEGIVLTRFIVASDVGRSRHFYADVLGDEVLREGDPSIIALANSWIVINVGGPPTDDKPTVTLETPRDPDHAAAPSTSASPTSIPPTSSGALAAPDLWHQAYAARDLKQQDARGLNRYGERMRSHARILGLGAVSYRPLGGADERADLVPRSSR